MLSPLQRTFGHARLKADDCLVLLIDVQEKLLAKIPGRDTLVKNAAFLLDVAKLAQVPMLATEQYPRGLGPTTETLRTRFTNPAIDKTAFSCCGAAAFLDAIQRHTQRTVIVLGMETHVCVMQTVLDLIDLNYVIHLPVDGVASRGSIDHDTALQRMQNAGATLSTVETIGFEWLGGSQHPQFKAFSSLVIERTS